MGHRRDTLKPPRKLDEALDVYDEVGEVMDEDLREFLAADRLPCKADPGFRERLREKLWDLVERNVRGTPAPGTSASKADDEEPGSA